jgi:hypothetical protein
VNWPISEPGYAAGPPEELQAGNRSRRRLASRHHYQACARASPTVNVRPCQRPSPRIDIFARGPTGQRWKRHLRCRPLPVIEPHSSTASTGIVRGTISTYKPSIRSSSGAIAGAPSARSLEGRARSGRRRAVHRKGAPRQVRPDRLSRPKRSHLLQARIRPTPTYVVEQYSSIQKTRGRRTTSRPANPLCGRLVQSVESDGPTVVCPTARPRY